MKWRFDARTGTMVPNEDKEIYFAKSMSGGLRIDDHKNNVKYIIERDGRITFIQKSSMKVKYDQMDARIIANRVLRMFGASHEYTDYKLFMRGI